ncbi:SusC/RagA family TonB-linked outer membrane protein [Chitinophaga oryzae]|uniref:SusC/RagA family TonB-linked outer membrane protein n=1 Tax=Chitinophaga oryzae TaxID=2725414 RepID=A0AAE6ZIQ7_9BACT|nr:SusC/RagA family TonB-linked outer membrane protein [Chitinophaga oryzae]QJB32622.1 SusC/RagA family TonB-linked outer membrane protein [Chitinophaga oryzae]
MEYNVPTKVGTEFSLRKIPSPQGRHTLIIIVAMKLIALLFLFNLQVTASVYSQRISLTASNTPLRDVLQSVRKQSGYSFFVESDNLRDSKPVNLNLWDNSVPEALDKIFENQPFTYTIQNNVIVVTRKERTNLSGADFLTFDSGAPDSTKVVYVQGSVRDDKGQPLVGVSVRVKGSGTGTVTKPDGTYTLKTNAAATLIFSYIGYLSREIKAQQGEIDVVLKQLNTALDQVQVIAYGTTTKRTSTGNIATINADIIEKQPVSNPLLALQGRVPGLFIQQTSGIPGANVKVNIQGINSLQQGTDPFFVVDGVPYPSVNMDPPLAGNAFPGGAGSTLQYINPSDIESITVLKDADATAIYGSRAANGAILITTKKGKSGNTKISFDLQSGIGQIPLRVKMMNTQDYRELRLEGKKNDNAPITMYDFDINGDWDSTKNTNWQKKLVGGKAHFTNLQTSVSGGTEYTQFLISGGYTRETTVYPGNTGNTRENLHFNINHRSQNQKFKVGLTGSYVANNSELVNQDLMSQAVHLPPNAPDIYNADGTLNWGRIPDTDIYSFNNPLAYQLRKYKSNTNNVIANLDLGYSILKGLDITTSLGYNKIQTTETTILPQASFNPGFIPNIRTSYNANKSLTSWIIEPKINYKKDIGLHHFEFLLGSSIQEKKSSSLLIIGTGFSSDAQLGNLASAPTIQAYPTMATYRYTGTFGRINYNYDNKYIVTLAGRRDGTTRFGSENRFANFYSIAGAWLFSEEKLIKDNLQALNLGKIRISYGTTGNDQIQDYLYLTLYNNTFVQIPYQQAIGIQPSGHSNPYLQWELTRKINFGVDIGILNNQLLISGNFHINRSTNQLINYPLGSVTGFSGIYKNIGAEIRNKSFELQIDATPLKGKEINWNISANLTLPQNKLVKFPNLDISTLSQQYVIGQPTSLVKLYPYLGVNPQTGLYEYRTHDGKITSSPDYSTDRTALVTTDPKYYGGITNTISYKQISLSFMFQFVKKTGITDRMTGVMPGTNTSTPIALSDRWKNLNDHATYQRASAESLDALIAYSSLAFSEAAYEDASYIKLRNVNLNYTFPDRWTQKIKVSTIRMFLQGQNLLTIGSFFGNDPESSFLTVLPPLRVVTGGINITL